MRRQATPTPVTVLLALPCAIVTCEIAGYRSPVELVDRMNTSFRLKGVAARASLRGDFVVVRES